MGACAGRGGDARGDVESEDPLTQIVCFARMAAHEVAQGPLEEQQNNDWQDQPLQAAEDRGDEAVQEIDRSAHGDRLARVRRVPRPGSQAYQSQPSWFEPELCYVPATNA